MKKIYSFLLAILIAGFAFAQNNVTVQVDMTGQTIASAGVHIAGSFQGWDPAATALIQVGTTDIYEATVNMADGMIEYKFLNGDAWGTDEGVPTLSGIDPANGNGNRWSFISGDTALPAIMFAGDAPMGKSAMRIAVDMSKDTVSADGVHAAGNFQASAGFAGDWDPATSELFNTKGAIYERIFFVTPDTFAYKFVNGNAWGSDEGVPSACAVNGNREANAMIDVAQINCYASCGPCPTAAIPTYDLTINVDMNGSMCSFDPTTDTVDFAGPFNGWAGKSYLTDPDNDGIYSITVNADSGEFLFKTRWYKTSSSVNWEGGGDKIIQLAGDTALPVRCFGADVYGSCSTLQPPADLTFRVDMSNETLQAGGVFIMGDLTSPNWQDGAEQMTARTDNPAIFEYTFVDFCPNNGQYKFVNGTPKATSTQEETYDFHVDSCGVLNGGFADNRVFERVDGNPVELNFVFNTCNSFSVGVNEVAIGSAFSIYPNPTNSDAVIALNYNLNSNYSIEVMDVTGKIILSAINYNDSRYSIDGDVLNSGLYLVKVTGNNTMATIEKLIVK
tara:strand:+ start:221 stop:1900 length:1680 start_codon:yes stop_codon:yes gene_type:complete